MTQIKMTSFEVNDLLFSLENFSENASDLLEFINAYVTGPSQHCCGYCESLVTSENTM